MDFTQKPLSGLRSVYKDGQGNITSIKEVDFTVEPWIERVYDGNETLIEEYPISRPTKDQPSYRLDTGEPLYVKTW